MDDHFSGYFISFLAGMTVALIGRPFWLSVWLLLSGTIRTIFSNLPEIGGQWTATFIEPTETRGEQENITETVILHQLGSLVWGEGRIADSRNRVFIYRGRIVRQTFLGSYRRKGSRKPSGTGTFQLGIRGDDKSMEGRCIWHDANTDKIEASQYNWAKTPNS